MIKLYISPLTDASPPTAEITKKILAYHLSINENDVKIKKTPLGKPYLENSNICFSVTHTKELLAVAVSREEIGIDAERSDRKISEGTGKRFLSGSTKIEDWVHFEAFSKLIGTGLSCGYEKMKKTPHNFSKTETRDHIIVIGTFGGVSLSAEEFFI